MWKNKEYRDRPMSQSFRGSFGLVKSNLNQSTFTTINLSPAMADYIVSVLIKKD